MVMLSIFLSIYKLYINFTIILLIYSLFLLPPPKINPIMYVYIGCVLVVSIAQDIYLPASPLRRRGERNFSPFSVCAKFASTDSTTFASPLFSKSF